MKRLLIAAGVAGLSLSAVVAQADHFRIRYRVQYSGGAYLGYPSTTTYSGNYYPMNVPGPTGNVALTGDANAQPVYPRFIGPGYTVTAQPSPYTSYGYNFKQNYQYHYGDRQGTGGPAGGGSGCNDCQAGGSGGSLGQGQPSVIIKNRLNSGGQTSHTVYPEAPIGSGYQSAPVDGTPIEVAPSAPESPASGGVTVPPPAAPKGNVSPVLPKTGPAKTARGNAQRVPVLVSDERQVGN